MERERVNDGGSVGGSHGVLGANSDGANAKGGRMVDGATRDGMVVGVGAAASVGGPGGVGMVIGVDESIGGGATGATAATGASSAVSGMGGAIGVGGVGPDEVADIGDVSVGEVGGVGVADFGDGSVPVTLRIPADRDYVVLVRSAAGHLGARAGFSMAEMQDWRLAVDEACGLLLLPDEVDATGEELECVFRLGADGVAVTVAAEARPGSKPQVGGFGWSLLAALVDGLRWAEEDGRVRVDIVKRAAGPDGAGRAGAR
jgi:serine/threonine-protein kinase RsbW